ncbi:MAG: MOSC domain-containing protein [Cyclobacteriaceae bacterium]
MESEFRELRKIMPQQGVVSWIGLRELRREPLTSVTEVSVRIGEGLEGDRFSGNPESNRQVTLIQSEHLDMVAGVLGKDHIDPSLTRRNIVISGINLLALKDQQFQIGEVVLETTGYCYPCSRMEENLGPGGYNAMLGHGGITTKVIKEGIIKINDKVSLL